MLYHTSTEISVYNAFFYWQQYKHLQYDVKCDGQQGEVTLTRKKKNEKRNKKTKELIRHCDCYGSIVNQIGLTL